MFACLKCEWSLISIQVFFLIYHRTEATRREILLILFQVAYNRYAVMKIKHLLEIVVPSFEKEMHVGKSFGVTKADSKMMPAAAFMGLTHDLSFSLWVMCKCLY